MLILRCIGVATLLVISIAWEPLCNAEQAHQGCNAKQKFQGTSLLQLATTHGRTKVVKAWPALEATQSHASETSQSWLLPDGTKWTESTRTDDPSALKPHAPFPGWAGLEVTPRKRSLEIGAIAALLLLSLAAVYLWLEKQFWPQVDGRAGTMSLSLAAFNMPHSRLLVGSEVQSVACDFIMVLAYADEDDSCQEASSHSDFIHHTTTTIMNSLRPTVVPGLEMAKAVFMDPFRHSYKSEEDLQELFDEEMTFEDYAKASRKLLAEMLTSNSFGFELEPFRTLDQDKVFWRLRMPDGDGVAQYAAHYQYKLALNDAAYSNANLDVPRNSDGDKVYAHLVYMPKVAEIYKHFKQVDTLKLMQMRIDRHVNLHALMKQKVLKEFIASHSLEHVNLLCSKWANLRRWYRFPKFEQVEVARNYFGERIAFMFLWQRFYMSALLVPAILGGIVFFRRFVLPPHIHDPVQIGFALVMALWAPVFNAKYARFEARTRQRWGMESETTAVGTVRPAYDAKLDGTFQVWIAPILGDVLALFMVVLSVLGIQGIQLFRAHRSRALGCWEGLMVSVQILTLDSIWQIGSRHIVHLENHRLMTHWWNSWIRKMLPVRVFTNLYPFVYVGFLKKYTSEGCGVMDQGCLDELQMDLCTFFVIMITKDIARDLLLISWAWLRMALNRRRHSRTENTETKYMFLQVQEKMYAYDDSLLMDDWTRQVTTFLLLVCFNVVLPVIGVFVLLTTMFEARLLAHRTCCHLQRPIPEGAPGIGAWHSVLEIMEVIGVLMTLAFAVFVMDPLAAKQNFQEKFIIFMISEHVLLVINLFVKGKYQRMPHDVQDIAEFNDSMVNRHFLDISAHRIHIETKSNPIEPSADDH